MADKQTSLKFYIEELSQKNTDYKYPEQAINQAESLKSLSSDLYTDNIRFIYELIQNADDAQAENVILTIVEGKYLIIAHDGKIFDKNDLEGLCGINNGTKKKDLNKTGYKGLGFKAVFGKSDYVLIYSNGEYFRFDSSHQIQWNREWGTKDQQTWERQNHRQFIYPWQINPIWTDKFDIPNSITNFLNSKNPQRHVAYAILINDISDIDSSMRQLKQQPHMFLFLRHISQVTFLTTTSEKISIVDEEIHHLKKLLVNKQIDSQWIIKHYELDVPESIRNKLSEDTKAPEKLRSIRKAEIFFAAKYEDLDGKITKVNEQDSILFSYLPTKIFDYKFPFLINGNFLTNVNREQIHTDSIWNQWLFEQIACQIFQWIKDLVHKKKFNTQAYRLIPSKLNLTNNILAKKFNESFDKMIHQCNFIRNRNNQFLKINQAILDLTSLSKYSTFININSMQEYLTNHDNQYAELPFVDYDENLEQIGVKVFTWNDCINMFKSDIFLRTHSIENNKQLIKYFHQKHSELNIDIQQIPFLMDQQNHLQIIKNIHLPQETLGENQTDESECLFIDQTICLWLNEKSQRTIKQWLKELGLEERTDLTYLNKTIIPNAAHFSTNENTIKTIKMLFKLFQKNIITKKELEQLKKLKLLTTRASLVPANRCFLSDQYKPRLCLEEFLNDKEDRFLSFDYVKEFNEDINEWRRFFLAIGVQEDLQYIVFHRKLTCYEAIQCGFYEQFLVATSPDGKHRVDAFSELTTIMFLQHTENNYEFSIFFWSFVIKSIKPEIFVSKVIAYWGHPDKSGAIDGTPLDDGNYVKWFVRNAKCIPTNEQSCELASDVFTNNKEMKDLCGKYMYFPSISLPQEKTQWNEIFNFKTKLTIHDYFDLLEKIRRDDRSLKDNLDRIQKIYNYILKGISSWSNDEQKQAKTRVKSLYLLTENEQWKLASDLYLYTEGTNNCLNEAIPCLKLDYTNRRHLNLNEFLEFFHVKRIGLNDLTLADKQSSPAESFRKKLIEISPFLKKWMKYSSVSSGTISSIDKIIQQENDFIESNSLELFYQNKFVQKTNVYYDHKHKLLYVTRPWNSETAFINLPNKLCQLFNIQGFEDKLRFLLKGTIEEIQNHFQLNSIEIPTKNDIVFLQPLPKSNTPQPSIPISHKSIPQTSNQNLTTVAFQPPPFHFIPPPQPVIPIQIRAYIPPVPTVVIPFEEAQIESMEMINLSSITISKSILFQTLSDVTREADQSDLITGRTGEQMVYKRLLEQYQNCSPPATIKWLNEKRESFLPYDIILTRHGKSQYIEVKSTRTHNQHVFPLSINEIECFLKEKDNYFIYRVYISEKELLILDNIRWRLINKQQLTCFLSIMPSETTD